MGKVDLYKKCMSALGIAVAFCEIGTWLRLEGKEYPGLSDIYQQNK